MRQNRMSEPPKVPPWFEDYFREHYRDLLVVALVVGGARHVPEADDAIQTVMVRQITSGTWDRIENPHAYFTVAVVRAVRAVHRSRSRHPEQDLTEAQLPTVEESTVWEHREWVTGLLSALPPAQRKVMALTFDGLSTAETADLLGCDVATVRSNLRHARRRLEHLSTEPEGHR